MRLRLREKIFFKYGFAFIEMLIAAAVLLFLVYKLANIYFSGRVSAGSQAGEVLVQEDIDTSSPAGLAQSARDKVGAVNKAILKRTVEAGGYQ